MDVLVNLQRLWPPERLRWGSDTPPWARAQGVQLDTAAPGRLTEWVITACGDWHGVVSLSVPAGGTLLHLTQLVPAGLLRPDRKR